MTVGQLLQRRVDLYILFSRRKFEFFMKVAVGMDELDLPDPKQRSSISRE